MATATRKRSTDKGPSVGTMPAIEAPTETYIYALRTEMERFFGLEDARIDRARQVRDLERDVVIPDPLRIVDVQVRDPAMSDEIQRVGATLTVNPPHLSVRAGKTTDKAQENATLREHWTEEVLKISGRRVPGVDTFQAAVDSVVGDGAAWTKLVFARDIWDLRFSIAMDDFDDDLELDDVPGQRSKAQKYDEATEDAKKGAGPPFVWTAVDVRTLYPVWDGYKLAEVLEVSRRPMHAVFRQYRLGFDAEGNVVPEELGQGVGPFRSYQSPNVAGEVVFLEHWTSTHVTYCVEHKNLAGTDSVYKVAQWEHGYGQVPYFFAPGLWRNYWKNRKTGWGVSTNKMWLYEFRAFLWTLIANVCARDAMTPLFRKVPADGMPYVGLDGQPKAPEQVQPATIYNGRPGEEISTIQYPDMAQSLLKMLDIVDQSIERLEQPRVESIGQGVEGAGFAINQQIAEARTRLGPLSRSIESMMNEVTRFTWKLVRNKIQEPVWVYRDGEKDSGWLKAGPEDLTDTVSIAWQLDPEMPSGKLIDERYWGERLKQGTANLDQAIEAMGDNPDEVRRGKMIDAIRASDEYQQFYKEKILQYLGRGDLATKQQAAALVATGQLPPEPLPGGMGNNLVPDMGQAALGAPGQGQPGGAPPPGPMGPPNGAVMGSSPGAVVPMASATPGAGGGM